MVFGTCVAAQDSVQRECVRSSIRVSQLFFSVTAATRISEAASSERLGMFEARRSLQPVLAESLQRALADDHVAEMRFVICAVEVCRVGPRGAKRRYVPSGICCRFDVVTTSLGFPTGLPRLLAAGRGWSLRSESDADT